MLDHVVSSFDLKLRLILMRLGNNHQGRYWERLQAQGPFLQQQ